MPMPRGESSSFGQRFCLLYLLSLSSLSAMKKISETTCKRYGDLVVVLSVLICLCVLLGMMGRLYWFADLFSHFRLQYIVCLWTGSVALFVLRRRIWAIFPSAMACVLTLALYPYYLRGEAIPASKDTAEKSVEHTLISFNLQTSNQQYKSVQDFLVQQDADIVFLMEVNSDWIQNLKPLEKLYPYRIYQSRQDNFGVAFYSKHKILEQEIRYFGSAGVPSIVAQLQLDDVELNFVGAHPVPPVNRRGADYRNQHIDMLARFVAGSANDDWIICGDFNASPWSFVMKDFLARSHLRDSNWGNGIKSTWLRTVPFLSLPIDHVFGSEKLTFVSKDIGSNLGSDHHPVITRFSLPIRSSLD